MFFVCEHMNANRLLYMCYVFVSFKYTELEHLLQPKSSGFMTKLVNQFEGIYIGS